jgi:hypothetical protein
MQCNCNVVVYRTEHLKVRFGPKRTGHQGLPDMSVKTGLDHVD